jgi:hypothetical protein
MTETERAYCEGLALRNYIMPGGYHITWFEVLLLAGLFLWGIKMFIDYVYQAR